MQIRTVYRSSCAVAATLLVGAVLAPAGSAAPGDPSVEQCFSSTVLAPCTQISPPFQGADVELSPDGKQVYVLSLSTGLIRVFDRGANNSLTPRAGASGCYNATGSEGCTASPGLGPGYDLDLSPDGTSVYVADGSLVHLQRDPSTGTLTPVDCYGGGAGCTSIAPVGAVYSVVVSKDNQDVYTRGGNTFGAFQRNIGSGTLIPEPDGEDCFSETPTPGCTDTYGLSGNAFEMDFSPDGKFLYYPIQTPGGIGFFQRSSNGSLTQISGPQGGCITTDGSSSSASECATIPDGSGPAMSNGWAATVAPSGDFVFVSGSAGTIVFSRDHETGKLTKTDCIAPSAITGCNQSKGSAGMGVSVSPSGTRAIVGGGGLGNDVNGIGVYDFNPATGTLTQLPAPLGCFSGNATAGCSTFPGGGDYGKTAWAPDGLNFYAVASSPLVNFVLDYPPTCQNRTLTVPPNTSTPIGLLCSDPNGDPVTLQISRAPTAGLLAGIDQAASSVRYNPFAGFTGSDSFGYQGVARGVASAEATVSLSVQNPPAATIPPASPAPSGPSSPKPRLTNPITASWKAAKTYTTLKSLTVANLSTGMSIRVGCKGRGCPFRTKSIAVGKAGTQNLTQLFDFTRKVKGRRRMVVSRLAVGAVVEVQVNAPDRIGEEIRYTMRKAKLPSSQALCVPPGGSPGPC